MQNTEQGVVAARTGEKTHAAKAFAAASAKSGMAPASIARDAPQVPGTCKSKFYICGVCHSDLHQVRDGSGTSLCPPRTPACQAMKSSAE